MKKQKNISEDCRHYSAQYVLRQYCSSFFQQFAAQVEAGQPLQFLFRATYSSFSRTSHIFLIFSYEPHTPHFLVRHTSKCSYLDRVGMGCRGAMIPAKMISEPQDLQNYLQAPQNWSPSLSDVTKPTAILSPRPAFWLQ